jgi:hypothetical protein
MKRNLQDLIDGIHDEEQCDMHADIQKVKGLMEEW